jgi:competence protein ComEA
MCAVTGAALLAVLATGPAWVVRPARAAAGQASPQPSADQGAQTFQRICNDCHDTGRILSTRRTKVGWEEVLDEMANKGATATDDEWSVILDYVLRHFGRVNVNRAPADELALILGLTGDQAASVVGYRTAHGPFADFDAFAKVPGLDPARLAEERDAITF